MLEVRCRPPSARIRKYFRCLLFGAGTGIAVGQSVIGESTSGVMELLMPMVQGMQEVREARNICVARDLKLLQPAV